MQECKVACVSCSILSLVCWSCLFNYTNRQVLEFFSHLISLLSSSRRQRHPIKLANEERGVKEGVSEGMRMEVRGAEERTSDEHKKKLSLSLHPLSPPFISGPSLLLSVSPLVSPVFLLPV